MSEWKTFPLQDVCIKIGSGATPTGGSSAYRSSGISLIRSQNILLGHFSKEGLAFIGEEQASKLNNVKVENGDILINITGDSVARVCKVPKNILPARVNQHVSILRANPSIVNNDYLNFFLRSPNIQETLLSISQFGATRKALTKEILEKFQITLPPLPIQKKIAKVLGDLDDKIELNRRMNETLEEMAMAVYRYYFVNFGLPPGAKEEATECPFGKLIEHPEMGMIPEGWSVGKLGDVVSNFDNKRIPLSKNQKMSCVKKNIPIMELHQSWIMLMNIFLMEFTCY